MTRFSFLAPQETSRRIQAIAAAPAALAQPNCEQTSSGGGGMQGGATTLCESPGNAQISSTPPEYAQPWYGGGMFPWDYGMFVL